MDQHVLVGERSLKVLGLTFLASGSRTQSLRALEDQDSALGDNVHELVRPRVPNLIPTIKIPDFL